MYKITIESRCGGGCVVHLSIMGVPVGCAVSIANAFGETYWDVKKCVPFEVEGSEVKNGTALGVDWNIMPKMFNFVAADSDGNIFAYSDRPVKGSYSHFCGGNGVTTLLGRCGESALNWENSIVERPAPSKPETQLIVDWSAIDRKYGFVAVDISGMAYAYSEMPRTEHGYWFPEENCRCFPICLGAIGKRGSCLPKAALAARPRTTCAKTYQRPCPVRIAFPENEDGGTAWK